MSTSYERGGGGGGPRELTLEPAGRRQEPGNVHAREDRDPASRDLPPLTGGCAQVYDVLNRKTAKIQRPPRAAEVSTPPLSY